jgi:hypothetical protein
MLGELLHPVIVQKVKITATKMPDRMCVEEFLVASVGWENNGLFETR